MIHAAPSRETRDPVVGCPPRPESFAVKPRATRVLVLAWLVVVVAPAATLRAQPESDAPATATSESVEAPEVQRARAHVDRAERLFDARNYEGALAEFERAHELLSAHPLRPQLLY